MSKADKQKPVPSDLNDAAQRILDDLAARDPGWRSHIHVLRSEYRYTAWQALASLAVHTLETGEYMAISMHPSLQPGAPQQKELEHCAKCHDAYEPRWAGQRYCEPCSLKAVQRREADVAAATEAKAESLLQHVDAES